VFAGELLPFTTPDGEREEVRVPEWVERGSEFAVAMAADGEWRAWRPAPELAMPSTRAIAEELSGLAGLGEGSAAGEAALAGRVVPTGVAASSSPAMDAPSGPADGLAAEPSDEIFAAIFAAPAFGDDDDDDAAPLGFGGNPLGEEADLEPPPPMP
jgi:hypothetical protein